MKLSCLLPKFRAKNGSALLITVGYLAAMTIFASTFLAYLNRTTSNRHQAELKQLCLNIAEGGMDKALAELRVRGSDYRGETNTSLGKGGFTVQVKPTGGARAYSIVSTGEIPDGKRVVSSVRIRAEVTLSSDGNVRELRWSEVKQR
jgi:hypothetical protein